MFSRCDYKKIIETNINEMRGKWLNKAKTRTQEDQQQKCSAWHHQRTDYRLVVIVGGRGKEMNIIYRVTYIHTSYSTARIIEVLGPVGCDSERVCLHHIESSGGFLRSDRSDFDKRRLIRWACVVAPHLFHVIQASRAAEEGGNSLLETVFEDLGLVGSAATQIREFWRRRNGWGKNQRERERERKHTNTVDKRRISLKWERSERPCECDFRHFRKRQATNLEWRTWV